MINSEIIENAVTQNGDSLLKLSHKGPVLLTFLRHFGCIFCREALHDLADRKEKILQANITLVLVHMSDINLAEQYFVEYELPGVDHISDPSCELYSSFGLAKGGPSQLLGLKNLIRGFDISMTTRSLPSLRFIGDGFQMPGIFILDKGNIVDRFIHLSAADRPNYDEMIQKVSS